jgi:hypothetical protein
MKKGQRVNTKYGEGTLIRREGSEGILRYRWIVKLDEVPELFQVIHERYGGLFFLDSQLTMVKNSVRDLL